MKFRTWLSLSLVVLLGLLPVAATAATGGPNNHGYGWTDAIAYSWIDTSGGTAVVLGDDANSSAIPFGFDFPFYGDAYGNFYIDSNGYIDLVGTSSSFSSQCPLSSYAPNDIIAVYWDDLNPSAGGTVRYLAGGSQPNRFMVI